MITNSPERPKAPENSPHEPAIDKAEYQEGDESKNEDGRQKDIENPKKVGFKFANDQGFKFFNKQCIERLLEEMKKNKQEFGE